MPKLLVFVPCEKIIIDENGGASVLGILQTVTAQIDENTAVPPDAIAPKEWGIFAIWQPLPGEVGKTVDQVFQLMWPDDKEFKKAVLPIRFQNERPQQTRANIFGFPIGQTGRLTLRMWLEENNKQVGEAHSYSIWVEHKPAATTATPGR